ncbi:ABC transporter ATP-binding protein [Agaricicola taiwanensis]|uniref:ABC transporter ATP-binding protein n=1 Tax=Agaricicola taiwanensis TaxID=591372 RepID=A0A8J3DYP6_9RHOB|nr:ABC transporter ATP-binding protein [Agaricicola taiwanensis]GGE50257.1 ABC transporter ATP-binding protein [Agaricicola taiwanensis]
MTEPVIELDGVSKRFSRKQDVFGLLATRMGLAKRPPEVRAVEDVSLRIMPGEVVGLVGESGCGKSTLGRLVAGILPMSDGRVLHRGRDMSTLSAKERKRATLSVQMIFQDPYASLNPRMRVADIVGEAPRVHGMVEGGYQDYVAGQLRQAGLDPAYKERYPHQFSGGQRQRIGIARALAVRPDFIVCDEAVASLDVSIQAQILNLFMDLRDRFNLTYLFVSHNLAVVQHISDRVVIMYLGRVVEEAAVADIFKRPNHPYTQALLSELPRIDVRRKAFSAIKGELPTPLSPPSGCHFHPRCPFAMPRCSLERPRLREVAPGQRSACHLNDLN